MKTKPNRDIKSQKETREAEKRHGIIGRDWESQDKTKKATGKAGKTQEKPEKDRKSQQDTKKRK